MEPFSFTRLFRARASASAASMDGQRVSYKFSDSFASDPNDSDFENSPSLVARRPSKRKRPTVARKRSQGRRRYGYGRSDDIVDDDDDNDDDDASTESFASASVFGSDHQLEPEVNANGRPSRSVTKRLVNYDEASEEDSESDISNVLEKDGSTHRRPRASLIVTLKTNGSKGKANDRMPARPTRAAAKIAQSGQRMETRNSMRLLDERDDAIGEPPGSNRVKPDSCTASRRPPQRRSSAAPSKGRKAPMKQPNIIAEASQESDGQSVQSPDPIQSIQDYREPVRASQVAQGDLGISPEDNQCIEGDQSCDAVVEVSRSEQEVGEDEDNEGPVMRYGSTTCRPRNPVVEEESSDNFDPGDNGEDEESGDGELSFERYPHRVCDTASGDDSTARRRSQRLQTSRHNYSSDEDETLNMDEIDHDAEVLARESNQGRKRRSRHVQIDVVATTDQRRVLRKRGRQNHPIDEERGVAVPSQCISGTATDERLSIFSVDGPFAQRSEQGSLIGQYPFRLLLADRNRPRVDDEDADVDANNACANQSVQAGLFERIAAGTTTPDQNADKSSGGGLTTLGRSDRGSNAVFNPVTVDESINFNSVGGLEEEIMELKEMVTLPMQYPEVFRKFKITPPRGVLFHGPPGTGKTLLARALCNAYSTNNEKVTFYMPKSSDILSKWVGDAERNLRVLFEEARKRQPSIIFFDEIDGLAPVRSSKSDQSIASIVATLLQLMDGIGDRGRVIVIGATNRPDNVDPALRRPGRFDREFRFPLPDRDARRSIIDIHTAAFDPPPPANWKNHLAEITKGYSGADIRGLCTQAALAAIQGAFPEIYLSEKKLRISIDEIKVEPKHFIISRNKLAETCNRSTSFAAALPESITPLLQHSFDELVRMIDGKITPKKKLTALEEAQYDDRNDSFAFEREANRYELEQITIHRPRLLIRGLREMGQREITSALLQSFEHIHIQVLDLTTLSLDRDKSQEDALVQLFNEARDRAPSIIYIPDIDVWFDDVNQHTASVFRALLRRLQNHEAVLILGTVQQHNDLIPLSKDIIDIFQAPKDRYELKHPNRNARREFFSKVTGFIRKPPNAFPNVNRKIRKLRQLEEAPEDLVPTKPTQKTVVEAFNKQDCHVLKSLKLKLQSIMKSLKKPRRMLKEGVVSKKDILHLFQEADPYTVTSDIPPDQRPGEQRAYELGRDCEGNEGFIETATGDFYYGIGTDVIQKRITNGHYTRHREFIDDVKHLWKDMETHGKDNYWIDADNLATDAEHSIEEESSRELVLACNAIYSRYQKLLAALPAEKHRKESKNDPPLPDTHTAQEGRHTVGAEGTDHPAPASFPPDINRTPLNTPSHHVGHTMSHKRQRNSSVDTGEDCAHPESPGQGLQHRDKRQRPGGDIQQDVSTLLANGPSQMAPIAQPSQEKKGTSLSATDQETSNRSCASAADSRSTANNGVASGSKLICDESRLTSFLEYVVERTSHLNVQHLQYVSSAMMKIVGSKSCYWDRDQVLDSVEPAFEEAMRDVGLMLEEQTLY